MRICLALFISVLAIQAAHWNNFAAPKAPAYTKADLPQHGAKQKTSLDASPDAAGRRPCSGKPNLAHHRHPDGKQLTVLCLNALTGKILHQQKLFDVTDPQFAHKFNSYASPTPVVEAGRAYVSWGSPGLPALTLKLLRCSGHGVI